MENIKKMQTEYLEMKTAMSVMKNILDGISAYQTLQNKSELSDRATEYTQKETYREKTLSRKSTSVLPDTFKSKTHAAGAPEGDDASCS